MLSYRLLRYINSAAMGLRQTVTSIEHALVLIGRQNMYRWLTLLLFGSAQNSPYAAALQETALARGRFMELIGERAFAKAERDSLTESGEHPAIVEAFFSRIRFLNGASAGLSEFRSMGLLVGYLEGE